MGLFRGSTLTAKRRRIIFVALLCLAFLAYVDWATGPSVTVTCFYLIPVFYLSWYGGWRLGLLVALLHGATWLAIDIRWNYSPVIYWNFAVRVITFAGIVWLVHVSRHLSGQVERLVVEKTQSLNREVELRAANEAAVRKLANQLSAAEDVQRRRMGQELHDSLGQSLTVLKLRLESMAAELPASPPQAAEMTESLALLSSIINQAHTLTFELYPAILDQLGLTATLRHYGEQLVRQVHAQVRVSDTGPEVTLPMPAAGFLFRAVKELINNALKHGAAREIIVQIRRRENAIRIVISDDGRGFDPLNIVRPGLGLAWIRERLLSLGGRMEMESAPGNGARIALDLPLEQPITEDPQEIPMASLLLVEDHTMFRAGIRALLERSGSGHSVVGEASDGLSAARLARAHDPDLTIMDISMPRLNGIETTRLIAKECPRTRIVMLSMHADPAFVHASLDAGAAAYVLKDAAFGELETALRAVLAGQKYLSVALRPLAPLPPQSGPASPALAALSPRERQILQLVGEANSSAEIAAALGLTLRTVETYRQNMMNKLGLHSAAALTAFSIKHGVCSTDVRAPDTSAHRPLSGLSGQNP